MSNNTGAVITISGCAGWLVATFQGMLIGLKLVGYIEWNWWLVLLPLIAYGLTWLVLLIGALVATRIIMPRD